jgi:hypothetical protein
MAIVISQTGTLTTVNAGLTTTQTVSITPTVIGSLLFITGCIDNGGSSSTLAQVTAVSDNVDGAWTLLTATSAASFLGQQSFIAYHANSSSTAARTVTLTITVGGSSYYLQVQPCEATGVVTSSPVDQSATQVLASGGATITMSPGITTLTANDLIVAVGSNVSGSAWTSPTTGWTALWSAATSGTSQDGKGVYQVASGTGTFAPTFTETGGNYLATATIISFKPAAAGPTVPPEPFTGQGMNQYDQNTALLATGRAMSQSQLPAQIGKQIFVMP